MRAPSWETSPGALAAMLNSSTQAFMADIFTITLSGGAVLRYTSSDQAVAVNGQTYTRGPTIQRGRTRLSVGVVVDSLSLTISADSSVTVSGAPILQFIAFGGFDGARVVLERAFASAPGQPWIGTLPLFPGRVSDTQVSRYEAQVTVHSDLELLNVMIPRNVYQPGCGNTLFDGACGLSKEAYAVTGTALTATNAARTSFAANLAQALDYFSLGWAVGVTGANAGTGRTIKSFGYGSILTIQPWPSVVAVGDTFTVYPGCDKAQSTCSGKFGNLIRFRGHPYVPAPETVL